MPYSRTAERRRPWELRRVGVERRSRDKLGNDDVRSGPNVHHGGHLREVRLHAALLDDAKPAEPGPTGVSEKVCLQKAVILQPVSSFNRSSIAICSSAPFAHLLLRPAAPLPPSSAMPAIGAPVSSTAAASPAASRLRDAPASSTGAAAPAASRLRGAPALSADLQYTEHRINELERRLAHMQARVTNSSGGVATGANAIGLAPLEQRVAQLEQRFAGLERRFTALEEYVRTGSVVEVSSTVSRSGSWSSRSGSWS